MLAISLRLERQPTELYLAEHRQLLEDWTTRPYVDIVVLDYEEGCPKDYEPFIYRTWTGTKTTCV